VTAVGKNTLPGMVADAVFDVTTATKTVASRFSLYESDWMTRTGLRFAGRCHHAGQGLPSKPRPARSPLVGAFGQYCATSFDRPVVGFVFADPGECRVDLFRHGGGV
jgi:hypothetical protein